MNDVREFERYMSHLSEGLGHADRHAGLRGYCTGLMAPLKRKWTASIRMAGKTTFILAGWTGMNVAG